MAPEFFAIRTFAFGFFLGVSLFIILYKSYGPDLFITRYESLPKTVNYPKNIVQDIRLKSYDKWFEESGLHKQVVNNDELRYTKLQGEIESKYLFKKVTLLCAVYTSSPKHAKAINETWSTSCNKVLYYSKIKENEGKMGNKYNTTSSFHLLCDAIRKIVDEYSEIQWALFVKDDMFVIPENLRYLLAPLNPDGGHYLGHAISFWGVEYNMALSGFVLSRGAMQKFVGKFPNTTSCAAGGKYWKQEDLYLGKHLTSMNIKPVDTRDVYNYTLFLGYDFDKMMFPGSTQHFTTYSTKGLFPVKCCGPHTITFPVLSSTEMYTYYYMIYTMRIFSSGTHGNKPALITVPDHEVWQEFLRSQGYPLNVSSAKYEEIWRNKIGSGQIIRPDKPFLNMPEVLSFLLHNFTSKKPVND